MENGDYITLSQAARMCPGKPHPSSMWRWCTHGVTVRPGAVVRLRYVKAGRRIFTSRKFLEEFLTEGAEAHAEQFDVPHRGMQTAIRRATTKQRQRSIEQAEQTLRKAGILE